MHIDFHDKTNLLPADQVDLLKRLLEFAAKREGVSNEAEMSVNFVRDGEIQELNRNYRQKNTPTDVISFAMQDRVDGEMHIQGVDIPIILGDIVISVDRAQEQADEYGHTLEREIAFLTIHGFLHLLGYDHMTETDEKEMFAKQREILSEFGIER
ncbi:MULTISPECIES: rRNA maturation RNase YbeY [Oceanobacillus]|uniref:Endoribonuclease YbeY n=1 Tax=Oceanobacillus indicireducens TaxID=1004261 RepID=A0A917XWI3_9BACI|nr:rRNA maturation RNase YbeY [Oceanobacillus indicireducens]GGN54604.1 endoribonuclease YbeY [Oceanobacillus indicireducens]